MKKILTSIAMALLLVGCAKQYDDSALQTRIADLERRVTSLESSVDALRSAIGEGVYVVKVQEYVDTESGKTIGVTVTYNNGDVKFFEITPKVDYAGPVVSIIQNGAGDLVWAVDGIAIKDGNGKDVTVYQTPVFTIDGDGNLLVSIDGSEPIVLGQVQNEGATLVDGIFTNIQVAEDKIILTLSDNSQVKIPYTPFKLNIEATDFVFEKKGEVIEVPYTVTGGTAGTKVEVTGYNPNEFDVEVTAEKIIITPLERRVGAVMAVHAQSEAGFYSVVKIEVNHAAARVLNPNVNSIVTDFRVDCEGGTLVANVVSNVPFDVVPDVDSDWITIVETKAMEPHTITMEIAPNTSTEERDGWVDLIKKGTETTIYTIFIDQEGFVAGPKDLSKDGSANSYILTTAGDYKFAAVKGNSAESVGAVASAELLWETYNTTTAPEVGAIISSVGVKDGFITFSTPDPIMCGNALIAAKDADGNILWSWHIWIPIDDIEILDGTALCGAQIMDRNLGALVATSMSSTPDPLSIGLFYQWGRKDPFPGNTSLTQNKGAAVAGTAWTAKGELITTAYSIAHPTEYAHVPAVDAGVWNVDDPKDLWNGEGDVKTIYDPCPAGYRVPLYDSSLPMWKGSLGSDWTIDQANARFAYGDIVFPVCGYLDCYTPAYEKAGQRTHIWASKWYDAERSTALYYREGAYYSQKFHKAKASVVRCVAE